MVKSNKIKFLSNTGWILGGKIFQMLIALVVNSITARYLGPGNYGIINYTSAYVAFFSSLSTLGLSAIIIKEIVENKEQDGEILGTSIVMRLCCSMLSMISIYFLVKGIHTDEPLILKVAVLQSIGIVFASFDTITFWYQSKLMSKVTTIIQSIAYLVMTVYRVIILILEKDVEWFAFAVSLDTIVVAIFLMFTYEKQKERKLKFSKKWIKILLAQSYPIILAQIMSTFYSQMDRIMLGNMIDQTSVGLYSTAVTIAGLWSFIPVAFLDSARPIIMEEKSKNQELYLRRLKQLYAFIIWLSIIYAVFMNIFSKIIIYILYGEDYMEANLALCIVVWYCAFSYLGSAKNIWIICEKKMKYETIFTAVGAICNLVLNMILIPYWGIEGAAVATLITQIVTNYLIMFVFKETRENAKLVSEAILLKDVLDFNALLERIKKK